MNRQESVFVCREKGHGLQMTARARRRHKGLPTKDRKGDEREDCLYWPVMDGASRKRRTADGVLRGGKGAQ